VNRDQEAGHRVRVEFGAGAGPATTFTGKVTEAVFGSGQYHWNPAAVDFNAHLPQAENHVDTLSHGGHADPDGPIVERTIDAGGEVELPAASIVVLRGQTSAN
jgi:hypothetical protein